MAQPDRKAIGKKAREISTFVSSAGVMKALSELGSDSALLPRAESNPKAFLKEKGVEVPRDYEITLKSEPSPRAKAQPIRIRVTVTICVRVGPVTICVTVSARF